MKFLFYCCLERLLYISFTKKWDNIDKQILRFTASVSSSSSFFFPYLQGKKWDRSSWSICGDCNYVFWSFQGYFSPVSPVPQERFLCCVYSFKNISPGPDKKYILSLWTLFALTPDVLRFEGIAETANLYTNAQLLCGTMSGFPFHGWGRSLWSPCCKHGRPVLLESQSLLWLSTQ